MNKPYIPQVPPDFGPIFERSVWKEKFDSELLRNFMYHIYFGASGTGKSVAISDTLKGKCGIIHISLRHAPTNDLIWKTFANSIGCSGSKDK